MAGENPMIVYALIDPRDNAVRYVGKSHRSAHRRLKRHLAPCYLAGQTHKERWIRSLLRAKLNPEIIVLETCDSPALLGRREMLWISYYRKMGADLTNATDGGDGGSGPHTKESREKIRQALIGKPKSEQHRINSGLGQRGRRASMATRAKLSASRRGRHPPHRYGPDNNKTKLTADAVEEIRRLRGIVPQRELGKRFGVSHTAIRYVQDERNWSKEQV